MSSAIRLEVIRHFENLPFGRETWDRLAARSETSTVFQTHAWFCSWWEAFGASADLWLLVAFFDDEPVGILPLVRKGAELRFATESHADYCDVIAAEHKEAVLRAGLRFLAEKREEWRTVALYNIPQTSSTVTMLKRALPGTGLRALIRGHVACPAVQFDRVAGGAERLLRKDSLQRPYGHFMRTGSLLHRNITDVETAITLLPRFFEQHIERWQGTRYPSLFLSQQNQKFYQALVRNMLSSGRLVFSVAEHQNEPIAFHIGFNHLDTFFWYKPSFDIRLQRHSPGNVMLRFLLQQAIENHKREFDFTVGDEPFKRRYSNVVRYNTNMLLTSRLKPYFVAHMRIAAKRVARLFLSDHR